MLSNENRSVTEKHIIVTAVQVPKRHHIHRDHSRESDTHSYDRPSDEFVASSQHEVDSGK